MNIMTKIEESINTRNELGLKSSAIRLTDNSYCKVFMAYDVQVEESTGKQTIFIGSNELEIIMVDGYDSELDLTLVDNVGDIEPPPIPETVTKNKYTYTNYLLGC